MRTVREAGGELLRTLSVGGGPAGLYAAILLKQADPAREVIVRERNAAGETFGFGVAFSDPTLANPHEADPETHERITGAFAHWDAIDIHYQGDLVRCGGNPFAGIARRPLVDTPRPPPPPPPDIPRPRASALGVRLAFEVDADGLAAAGEADLVLAADGVGSAPRTGAAAGLRPRPGGATGP